MGRCRKKQREIAALIAESTHCWGRLWKAQLNCATSTPAFHAHPGFISAPRPWEEGRAQRDGAKNRRASHDVPPPLPVADPPCAARVTKRCKRKCRWHATRFTDLRAHRGRPRPLPVARPATEHLLQTAPRAPGGGSSAPRPCATLLDCSQVHADRVYGCQRGFSMSSELGCSMDGTRVRKSRAREGDGEGRTEGEGRHGNAKRSSGAAGLITALNCFEGSGMDRRRRHGRRAPANARCAPSWNTRGGA
eukprot:360622-Chlamydomonas_euryale.AAC.15